jgi:hypothetical protein
LRRGGGRRKDGRSDDGEEKSVHEPLRAPTLPI